ncbi:MAG TPA: sterol desaturase family protein [Thermoanaerobaculia bacterium]|nr:sterol desaturase family protein [Thermoanaerobaculia bacterium]
MSLLLTVAAVAAAALLLLLAERAVPLRKQRLAWLPELALNVALSALAFGVSAVLVRPAVLRAMGWSRSHEFGLVYLADLPPLARGLLVFMLLDLAFYYWHRLNHEWPALWRFHNVHHCDPDLGVSTSFRFHFGEVALSTVFRVVQVTVIGASLPAYAAYEVAFQLNTLFHHSNVRLPIRLERWLNRVLVTPRMHGIHHSQVRDETNSNYSVVLPWWDWLHRTLRLNVPQDRIVVGVPGYAEPADNRLWPLLAMPFRRQRVYWSQPDGTPVERDPASLGSHPHRLEE